MATVRCRSLRLPAAAAAAAAGEALIRFVSLHRLVAISSRIPLSVRKLRQLLRPFVMVIGYESMNALMANPHNERRPCRWPTCKLTSKTVFVHIAVTELN